MDDQPVQVMSAADAARQLGVSPSGLRRLGTIYAAVHGELGRELHTDKRIWTGEVVERLGQARALVEVERYRSIKEALGALDKGVDIDLATDLATPVQAPTPEALGVLLEEVRSLQRRLDGVERLEARIEALQRQLEAPRSETERVAQLERINAHLMDEIQRQRQTPAQDSRVGDSGDVQAGVLVRAASRLERLWRAVSGRS